jgi:hypothetical protein
MFLECILADIEKEVSMQNKFTKNAGLKMLLKKYQKLFRIPENLNFYSEKDYQVAEKKFVKFALLEGKV